MLKQNEVPTFININDVWSKTKETNITAIDLFCGCGGISKGLELAGIKVLLGLDFFKEAGDTYKKNFKHQFILGDITKKEIKESLYSKIKEELKGRPLNIIAGGFPCQGFSLAGKRDIADARNKLYLEILSIVKKLKPEFIFLENVKGLLSMDGGKVKKLILEDFRSIGYNIDVCILDAANYKTPQKRERVVFIGNRIGKTNLYPKSIIRNGNFKTTKDAIVDLMYHPQDITFNHLATKHSSDMEKRLLAIPEGKSLYPNYSDSWKKCAWNEPSCTIKENHGGVNVHPKLPRVLTARECARIQSFPDDFIFEGTKSKQLIQIGNAVPPNLSKAVGLSIIKSYEQN